MEQKDDKLKRLLDLLGEEVTETNEENHLNEWSALMDVMEDGFEDGFVDKTMFQIGKLSSNVDSSVKREVDFSTKVIQMFGKIAFSGAAAILLLIGYSWLSEGSVSPDALLGFNQISEAAMDITSNFYSNY